MQFTEKHQEGPKFSTEISKSQSSKPNLFRLPRIRSYSSIPSGFIWLCSFHYIRFYFLKIQNLWLATPYHRDDSSVSSEHLKPHSLLGQPMVPLQPLRCSYWPIYKEVSLGKPLGDFLVCPILEIEGKSTVILISCLSFVWLISGSF